MAARLPILEWLPSYDRRGLRGDIAAGIAVTALIVPKDLGYAGIAGVPLQNGLYAAAAGAIIYALFCTSRQISTGPSSSLAAVAGGAVVATGLGGAEAAQLVAAIAIATGVLFVLLAVFRLGRISQFLSKAVVTGFLAGARASPAVCEKPINSSAPAAVRIVAAWSATRSEPGSAGSGRPRGTSPTSATPWASRSKTTDASSPPTTSTSAPGTFGATTRSPKITASEAAPTSSVVACTWSSVPSHDDSSRQA